ncbi:MAG: hypothetical protein RL662_1895 [Bacteroidota bacterium]|jgi:hypothetical protein
MKKYNRYIKSAFTFVFFSLLLNSCSEDTMDKINNNDNNPLEVPAEFLIADLQTSTAFSVVGGDFSTYASVYVEHEAGVHNQMYNAETRTGEPSSLSTYNNPWEAVYRNIRSAKVIIKNCSPEGKEPRNKMALGIAKVLLAYNAAIATDLFGDVPYFQAGEINNLGIPVYFTPKVDKQEDIYKDILKNIDEAIAILNSNEAISTHIGSADLYYDNNGENKTRWIKAAYGLKARYTMRLLGKSKNQAADLANIIEYANQSFTSAADELKYSAYNGGSQNNPLARFSQSRSALGASKSYVNKMTERNDPRLTSLFVDQKTKKVVADIAKLYPAPNGSPTQLQTEYDFAITNYSYAGPTQLLSYHELMFIKAEAYARQNNLTASEEALKLGINAAFTSLEKASASVQITANKGSENEGTINYTVSIPESIRNAYFTENVKPLFDANPLKEVVIQKYLAFMGASGESVEAYNDYRRLNSLDKSLIVLENPLNTTSFPLRYTYGDSDDSANPNIHELTGNGTYVYTENVWWAGGTR